MWHEKPFSMFVHFQNCVDGNFFEKEFILSRRMLMIFGWIKNAGELLWWWNLYASKHTHTQTIQIKPNRKID